MSEKKAKIQQAIFSNEWVNAVGKTNYYFDIVLDNGESGSVGVADKDSPKIKVGSEITYTLNGKKIKIITSSGTHQQSKTNSNKSGGGSKNSKQEQFLGYAWSYAKDLIIAGKTMKDVEELNEVSRYIYDEIGKMLNGE